MPRVCVCVDVPRAAGASRSCQKLRSPRLVDGRTSGVCCPQAVAGVPSSSHPTTTDYSYHLATPRLRGDKICHLVEPLIAGVKLAKRRAVMSSGLGKFCTVHASREELPHTSTQTLTQSTPAALTGVWCDCTEVSPRVFDFK